MKRIITSILAFFIIAALFTGCGQTDNIDKSSVSTVVEVKTSESGTINEITSETTTAETTKTVDTSGKRAVLSDDYEDILRAFYDATNSDDYENVKLGADAN